jgi:hypothetical protein
VYYVYVILNTWRSEAMFVWDNFQDYKGGGI